MSESVRCEQVVLGWSANSLLGGDGFGPVFASAGWRLPFGDRDAGPGTAGALPRPGGGGAGQRRRRAAPLPGVRAHRAGLAADQQGVRGGRGPAGAVRGARPAGPDRAARPARPVRLRGPRAAAGRAAGRGGGRRAGRRCRCRGSRPEPDRPGPHRARPCWRCCCGCLADRRPDGAGQPGRGAGRAAGPAGGRGAARRARRAGWPWPPSPATRRESGWASASRCRRSPGPGPARPGSGRRAARARPGDRRRWWPRSPRPGPSPGWTG